MALLTIRDGELEKWKADVHHYLHKLWTKAVGTEDYVKQEWKDFAKLLQSLDIVKVEEQSEAELQANLDALERLDTMARLQERICDVLERIK
jgi:hypothetical protein